MKKCLLLTVLMFTVFAACGAAGGGTTAAGGGSGEQVQLSFMSHTFGPWNEALTDQVAQYMELNPHVVIDYIVVPGEDLWARLAVMLEAGKGTDIVGIYYPTIINMARNGRLDPAPPHIVDDIINTSLPSIVDLSSIDGTIFGYVQHVGVVTPVINVDLWEGDFPDTWREWANAAEWQNVYEGGVLVRSGAQLDFTSELLIPYSSFLWAFGGEILSPDLSRAAFNTPVGLEALQYFARMCHPILGGGSGPFLIEMSASILSGPWNDSLFREQSPDLNFRAMPVPMGDDGNRVVNAYSWLWCVNADSPDYIRDAAWDFLQWLSAPEQYTYLATRVGFVPIHTAAAEDPELANDPWISQFMYALSYGRRYQEHENWSEIQEAMSRNFQRGIIGEITLEQALEDAERDVNAILGY